jgi:hypothetical protein
MTDEQREALKSLCGRYNVEFDENDYVPAWDLPTGWVSGWVGGNEHVARRFDEATGEYVPLHGGTIFVGVSPDGSVNS